MRKTELLETKHKEFIQYVIKDWLNEIGTETAVTLEFIDQKIRYSTASSYSSDDFETKQLDLHASLGSMSTDDLI